jgi:hypothetical protein
MSEDGWTIPQELGAWVVEMTWAEDEIQGGPSMLVIRPADAEKVPLGGLSSTILRQVDFREGAEKLRAVMAVAGLLSELRGEPGKGPAPIETVRDALEQGVSDDYLALLAVEYVGRVNAGQEKPVDHMAEELGRSLATIKGHLWQARKRGLLTGGSPGRKGGETSEEARQLAMNWAMERALPAN